MSGLEQNGFIAIGYQQHPNVSDISCVAIELSMPKMHARYHITILSTFTFLEQHVNGIYWLTRDVQFPISVQLR